MIFLTGPHGAGKTTVGQMLSRYNFDYLDLGVLLRRRHQKENSAISFGEWCSVNEAIYGSSFTDSIILEEILTRLEEFSAGKLRPQDLIIVGSRSLKGIQYIIRRVPLYDGRQNIIIFIDAPFEVLRRRYCARERERITKKEFQEILDRDNRMGLREIMSKANIVITNTGSKKELEKEFNRIAFERLSYSRGS